MHVLALSIFLAAQTGPGELDVPILTNENCRLCHSSSQQELSYDTWRGSMMSFASYDPVFRAAFEIAIHDQEEVAGLCFKCHFPGAFLSDRGDLELQGMQNNDFEGIACDLCHRFQQPSEPLGKGNANFVVYPGQVAFGPFDDPAPFSHDSRKGDITGKSDMCGQCHDVTDILLERRLDNGEGTGRPMPVERTFTEWEQSAFAREGTLATCQDCHMPTSTGFAVDMGREMPTRTLRSHRIVGGSTVPPRMMAALAEEEDAPEYVKINAANAEVVAEEAERFLQQESATLEVISTNADAVRVRVTNLTGHKLPTGYSEGRRMFLSANVSYADGACGPRTGTLDPETCEFLEDEPPLENWEVVLGNPGVPLSFHFALVDTVQKDSRIPPLGFLPDEDTMPVGKTFETLPDGTMANYDDVIIPLGDVVEWPARIHVQLHYQQLTGDFLRFLVNEAEREGPTLARLWTAVDRAEPTVMQDLTIEVDQDGTSRLVDAAPPAACLPPDFGSVPASACLQGPSPDDVLPPTPPACECTTAPDAPPAVALLLAGLVLVGRRQKSRDRG
jgi:MYXO-CTERM domain-containing protein